MRAAVSGTLAWSQHALGAAWVEFSDGRSAAGGAASVRFHAHGRPGWAATGGRVDGWHLVAVYGCVAGRGARTDRTRRRSQSDSNQASLIRTHSDGVNYGQHPPGNILHIGMQTSAPADRFRGPNFLYVYIIWIGLQLKLRCGLRKLRILSRSRSAAGVNWPSSPCAERKQTTQRGASHAASARRPSALAYLYLRDTA